MTETKFDRRTLFGLAGAAGASMLLFGRSTGAAASMHFAVNHTPAQWRQLLGAQRYEILREAGTELENRSADSRSRVHGHAHDSVGPRPQEQIASLAADVSHR